MRYARYRGLDELERAGWCGPCPRAGSCLSAMAWRSRGDRYRWMEATTYGALRVRPSRTTLLRRGAHRRRTEGIPTRSSSWKPRSGANPARDRRKTNALAVQLELEATLLPIPHSPAFVPRTTRRRQETAEAHGATNLQVTLSDPGVSAGGEDRAREHSQGGDTGSNPVGTTTPNMQVTGQV
jgi:hypothetical protein